MENGRWQQIDRLLDAALELGPDLRAAFVAEACADDAELRREVESLLAAHVLSKDFIEEPALDLAARLYADAGALARGQAVGRYEVKSLLGRGGMGEVYLARDTELRRPVALKVVSAGLDGGREALRRFEQEALAVSALNHPNILTVYEVGRAGPLHYIASEFVDGVTLRQRLGAGSLEVAEALDIAAQIASALAAAHEAGVVHRDIKPENVMVRRDGYVKVLDFGIAKFTSPGDAAAGTEAPTQRLLKTATGLVIGTASYMSPEQARGLQVDARTDIWSLGCVLYEICAARPPFGGATPSDVLVSILDREPPDLALVSGGAPAELSRVVARALRKDREERYGSADEMGRELKALKLRLERGEGLAGEAQTALRPAPEQHAHAETVTRVAARGAAGASVKKNRRALLFALVATSLLLAFGLWTYTRRETVREHKAEAPPPPPAPVRTLAYSVTVQKYRDGKPYERSFDLGGEVLFEKDYRVRLNVRSQQDGHLYILNERPAADGVAEVPLNILFPSPTTNGGESRLPAGGELQIPSRSWFQFDGEEGAELVWLVWSDVRLPELEALKSFANPRDRGMVGDREQAQRARAFLRARATTPPAVERDNERRETRVTAEGGTLAHVIRLEHH